MQHAVGGVQGQRPDRVVAAGRDGPQLGQVRRGRTPVDQVADRVVGERLGVADQRDAGREPLAGPR